MIKNPGNAKSLSFDYKHSVLPEVTAVQIIVDNETVTVSYMNEKNGIVDAEQWSMAENPELKDLVSFRWYDDVWNLDLVLSLVEPIDEAESCPPLDALVPAYLQSLQAAS